MTDRFNVHELSIAQSLVSTAVAAIGAAASRDAIAALVVDEVHLRLGRLAGVEKESLLFCYDIVIDDTPLAGSRLVVEELPVVIFCASCQSEVELPGIQRFYCPRCGQPSSDIRQGRELELVSIHFIDRSAAVAE
jgi:hydrogenase nickel incorporation protein HypA/HybF